MNIALIGPRGSGKSRVSRCLARWLKWPVLSLDALISYESEGVSIPELLARHDGDWRAFRDIEHEVLTKAAALNGVILDCGGGIVVDVDAEGTEIFSERKAKVLRDRTTVFYLHPSLDAVVSRISGGGDRPSLSDTQSAEMIYNRRLPWYRQVAHHEIPVKRGRRPIAARAVLEVLAEEQNTDEIRRALKRAKAETSGGKAG